MWADDAQRERLDGASNLYQRWHGRACIGMQGLRVVLGDPVAAEQCIVKEADGRYATTTKPQIGEARNRKGKAEWRVTLQADFGDGKVASHGQGAQHVA